MMNSQPTFMNVKMLQDAVAIETKKMNKSPQCCILENTDFDEVNILHLKERNILKIDLLHYFTSLVKLDLFNNLISKIEGLDCLSNLTWLNLSFNKITKIEGLGGLQKLEVLDLSNNKISLFENMDTLENLSHVLIANNLIKELDNVLYLRRIKKLYHLYMVGNPVTKETDYTLFLVAFLPKLTYLDSTFIDTKIREKGSIKYQDLLDKITSENLKGQSNKAENASEEDLNGSSLFDSMFKDNPEVLRPQCLPEVIQKLPEVAPLLQTFEVQMMEVCLNLSDIGLADHKQRETELKCFYSGQDEVETFYKQKAAQIITEFDEQHSERTAELKSLENPDLRKVKIKSSSDAITELHERLQTVELELVCNLEDNIKELDGCISGMVDDFMETVQKTFAQLRDLEENYYQNVKKIAFENLEKVANQSKEEEIPEDVMRLFTDQDSVKDALATSHKIQQLKINERENQLIRRVRAWKSAFNKELFQIQVNEVQWNHMRVSDNHRYMDYLRKQLEDVSM